ncbi:MAG: IgGFc-binding protein [Myxococcota bacterium]|jgi:hypothetical protein|nr:IgGFc-binding protein [Myxococcota bacterium]
MHVQSFSKRLAAGWPLLLALLFACSDPVNTTPGDDTLDDDAEISDADQPDPGPDKVEVEDKVEEPDEGCDAGEARCTDTKVLSVCVAGQWEEQLCLSGTVCNEAESRCQQPICPVPGLAFQCESETVERVCESDQLSYTTRDCEEGLKCVGGQCVNQICYPGQRRCKTATEIEECDEFGALWAVVETCTGTTLCGGEQCLELCEVNAKTASFLGCEYYAVDMDNAKASQEGELATDDMTFAITVSNPHPQLSATVVVNWQEGSTPKSMSRNVLPGELEVFELTYPLDAETGGFYNNSVFYIQSSIPVTAHQFNPLNGNNVYSNDATLLLPINAYGLQYMALNYPVTQTFDPNTYIDIVGTENNTSLTITSPVALPATGGFGALPANTPTNYTLNKGQLLHLLSSSTQGHDISGMEIVASAPVGVFSGTRCANIPNGTPYCDHIEMQLFPVETWGKVYHATKFFPRGTEDDVWRIIAAQDNTTVALDPAQGPLASFTLDKGEVREFRSKGDFVVTGSGKLLVGQFMVGSEYPGVPLDTEIPAIIDETLPCDPLTCTWAYGGKCIPQGCVLECGSTCSSYDGICSSNNYCAFYTGVGDPAFTLLVPSAQYRQDYIVLTPPGYERDYLNVITPRGRLFTIDAQLVSDPPWNQYAPVPLGNDWDVYRLPVADGVHSLSSNGAFGVQTYGYNQNVSYAYPGGLNLLTIN